MRVTSLAIVATVLACATPALAQGTQQTSTPQTYRSQTYTTRQSRTPVATQPSNNPFVNPIGQGVPPAVSANPNLNGNRTSVPH